MLCVLAVLLQPAEAAETEWEFDGWAGPQVPVRMYVPDENAADAPVVIVMHGASRDAPRYYKDWKALGEKHGFIVVVPEFSKRKFEKSARYNLGHVFDPDSGKLRDEALWTFSVIEALFDAVVQRVDGNQSQYALYGHSAGSQFVHRFMYYKPDARVSRYIAANAGWYTVPVYDFEYPYGLTNSGIEEDDLKAYFAQPLLILLGREDTDKDSKSLRKTPEAMQQGPHRLARGLTMYRVSKRRAEELGFEFNWELQIVDGADHVNAKMALPAAQWVKAAEKITHDVVTERKPWTDRQPQYAADTVRFAVFSDLTGGEREQVFEIAVEQLNLLRPELIVNVGDLIEGSADRLEIDRQWDSFEERAAKARAPVFYTGGNHDLLGENLRAAWQERNGPRYYHVRYRDVLFLVLDTEDHPLERLREIAILREETIRVAAEHGWDAAGKTEYANLPEDTTGMISSAQADAITKAIAENDDVRWTFLLMHKAPWAADDMPAWQAIEHALGDRPYTVFHGHRHGYQHEQRNGRDYIRLATTGGVFLSKYGPSFDHLVWVTVDKDGAHIANLKMSGILDKTGSVPLDGGDRCLQ